ncbi:hypothetical protein MdSGHV020 [Musca domestica salivary gland hypertrophy virus]|uniref:Uncharacterized protein n=1 Tax=Musca hytrovirus(isolate Musca domestica/United States/Boucias/-) TaxID=523909 RepID=B2YFZ7_MHVB|nr:hypothetical protein MdSGHV020 [Musca domestica salivary gland hypertrophy virus]ACD03479.1 hypothetical protein MdSGHV020 [Musca domestica salivary gland hypertrophy virus]
MSQQAFGGGGGNTLFQNGNSSAGNRGGVPRLEKEVGDENIAKVTSVVFNPKNLRMYQIAFVVLFIVYIWMTEFANVATIMRSLFVVALLALMTVETILIVSYIH